MNAPSFCKIPLILALAGAAFSSPAQADNDENLSLRHVMRSLGMEMQQVTDGISRQAWKQVENAANNIADHPKPALAERQRVMAFLGTDATLFKQLDKTTHQTARRLKNAAAKHNGKAVIDIFATLQHRCLACHQRFRQPLQTHLR